MDWNAFATLLKEFKDFVFRPFTLVMFGLLGLILLILPKSFLTWLGLATLTEQHRATVSIATIILVTVGIIRTLDVYFFPWRRQRKQQEREKEGFRDRIEALSIYELSILAYCLSVDRKTFFVLEQGREPFEDAVRSLTARGFFKQGPFVTHGYSYDITDDCWALLQDFKWGILNRAEASYPDLKQKIEFYHAYQIKYGFWQTTIPAAELAKIISVFRKK